MPTKYERGVQPDPRGRALERERELCWDGESGARIGGVVPTRPANSGGCKELLGISEMGLCWGGV